ncbi:MAG: PIG-L family deacetylase [Deltaproteobacteria bacterium]|nr:PIG-L family deacetylase [Deltaproteobacteria bacterium]
MTTPLRLPVPGFFLRGESRAAKFRLITFALLSLALVARIAGAVDIQPSPFDVATAERLLVIAPHPDDETLGAAGLVQRVLARGGTVRVVLVTAGDGYVEAVVHETHLPRPRPAQYIAYGERRLAESRAAVRVLGGDHLRLTLLGFPDGGLDRLLHAHWRRSHPERSQTTGA